MENKDALFEAGLADKLAEQLDNLVTEIQKRKDFYQKLANKKVQVKRQYFQGKTDAFLEVLEELGANK